VLFQGYPSNDIEQPRRLRIESGPLAIANKRTIEIHGTYGEVSGLIPMPPFSAPGVPEAFELPSTLIDPQLTMVGPPRHHQIIVKCDCCQ
jgi:hypothetical protein